MDATERQVIDELFGKVKMAENQTGPRDNEAAAYISNHVTKQPAAPYYMAQAIIIQEEALKAAQARIEELEQQAVRQSSGGFLGGLFGTGKPPVPMQRRTPSIDPRIAAYTSPQGPYQGQRRGGFLAGAMETAVGVAGGMLLANAIGSLFTSDAAAAEEPAPDSAPEEDFDTGDMEF